MIPVVEVADKEERKIDRQIKVMTLKISVW
jgi:hypothetical protein